MAVARSASALRSLVNVVWPFATVALFEFGLEHHPAAVNEGAMNHIGAE